MRGTDLRSMGPQSADRRRLLRAVPAVVAAGLTAPALAHQAQEERAVRLGKDTLKCAEQIAGVQFTDAEEELMLGNVNANREIYETLRKIPIPADTEPAFRFQPALSANRPAGRATPNANLAVSSPASVSVRSSIEELAFLPVTAIAPLIEHRKVSSTDLTRMYLGRLKRYDETLKCVITLTEELALEQAATADREIRAGRYRGPLHGIPWGVKDLFATKGLRTTWGARPYENQVSDADATVVGRLREAGAVLVAKLSTGELAIGDLWFGGKTRNPWNPEKGASGSSAGPASATAAGLVGFAVGTETNGSLISPSSTCGVVGLRPTYGRISRHGVMALRWTMDKVGPLCRSVEDCALVLNAIYGPDGHDDTVVDAPFTWHPDSPLSALRIGFVRQEFEELPADANEEQRKRWPERKALLTDALDVFRSMEVRLEPIALPDIPAGALYSVLNAEAGAAFDELVRSGAVSQLAEKGPNGRANQLRWSRFIPAVEYIRAQRVRTLLIKQMSALMSQYDLFLAPSAGASVTLTNLTGHPAITLKVGFVDNLPQALMIVGRLYDEGTLLRAALAYERATRWHTMNPTLT